MAVDMDKLNIFARRPLQSSPKGNTFGVLTFSLLDQPAATSAPCAMAAGGLMAPNITTSRKDGVIVVSLSGVIYFGQESAALRLLVKELLNKSHQIVLDLKDVTHIDSGGLGTLVGLYAFVRKVGGDLKLANLGNHAHELLQITKLARVFEVFDNAKDAIASFERTITAT